MGSSRLPGKVLMDIAGKSMLYRTISQSQRACTLTQLIVATTVRPEDQAITEELRRMGVAWTRGSSDNVLDRYLQAAREFDGEIIVRITSDCPLIDPNVIDLVVSSFLASQPPVHYASNTLLRTYPRGLDVEVFSREALEAAAAEASTAEQREHVTPYLYQEPSKFRLRAVTNPTDYSHYRWTVDTTEDLDFVREIHSRLDGDGDWSWQKIVGLLEREPGLVAINQHIQQKTLTQQIPL